MTYREEIEKAWIAVESHCIVSPSGATPVWRDFRRDLITKFVAAKVAAVRAETLREARYEVEKVRQQITTRAAIEFPRPSAATKDAINALVSLTDGILTALDALAQPEGTA